MPINDLIKLVSDKLTNIDWMLISTSWSICHKSRPSQAWTESQGTVIRNINFYCKENEYSFLQYMVMENDSLNQRNHNSP